MHDADFGRVRRALLREGEGDRVPLFEISVAKSIKETLLGRPIEYVSDEIDFWHSAGYDFVPIRSGVRSVVRGYHPLARQWLSKRNGPTEKNEAPGGWVHESEAIARNREEFESFPWPAPQELGGYNDYVSLEEYLSLLDEHLPEGMKVLAQLGYVFMGAWQLMGFENFCVKLVLEPELVHDVIGKLGDSQLGVLDILLDHDCVGAIWMPDDLCYNSGPIIAPSAYREFIYPWYVKIVERCRQANIPVGLHSDGDLTALLSDLVECGFDAIHPFEPPMNDIVAIKARWGDQISVAGNIDLKKTLCNGTPEDVEREVREKAALLAPGGGWLLGSSNSIPSFTPFENYRALLEAGLKYGSYSS